jgi:hypothetical protein
MQPSGADLVRLARTHIGERYVLGTLVPKDNARWRGPWDCAEFASWLVYQLSGWLYGCDDDDAEPSGANANTRYWRRDVRAIGELVSIEVAAGTPGAFALRHPVGGHHGHVALSDGEGGTVEARSSRHGVCAAHLDGRRWDAGILIPWLRYPARAERSVALPAEAVLRLGSAGALVGAVQRALTERGLNPGATDGIYGPHTAAAVRAFQLVAGLVVDGEAGHDTIEALGIAAAEREELAVEPSEPVAPH